MSTTTAAANAASTATMMLNSNWKTLLSRIGTSTHVLNRRVSFTSPSSSSSASYPFESACFDLNKSVDDCIIKAGGNIQCLLEEGNVFLDFQSKCLHLIENLICNDKFLTQDLTMTQHSFGTPFAHQIQLFYGSRISVDLLLREMGRCSSEVKCR
jgi:hypothetical protein